MNNLHDNNKNYKSFEFFSFYFVHNVVAKIYVKATSLCTRLKCEHDHEEKSQM